ncbi:MAG: hypothetical protein HON98_00510 [Chloroflexi bacterium]|jgi:phenylalanine-4-hydroxylase|nr:hypothetical protein [Chloroflexota bacterium]MBT4002339.1 hypothetical protein [Chloroflexota bacterium]MBT4306635.1 hypothetical protein [Chloroflexota bacterium]MBT4533775.1 hypothetical protein [Chloroflexota bacterium]MBT4681579.1 hypothetical protein [Chloroflexota bacterium]
MTSQPNETSENQEVQFSDEEHLIWKLLYDQQINEVKKYASKEFLSGLEILDLPSDNIPALAHLNSAITPNTGWKTVRTDVRYTDAVPWYNHFNRKEFLVTNYLRSKEELEFTPEPDMFHDIFGHLPFMTLPHYTELQEMFAPAFLRANDAQRENIKRLAWYSTEFGLIIENNERKLFGTGLISSSGEMSHVLSGNTPIEKFTIDNVTLNEKAIYNYNGILFEFDSIDSLKIELSSYFDKI